MYITDDIRYIGVNDHQVDLFEGQYSVPNGMSYNSYVILDKEVAVLDTVDSAFCEQWLENLASALDGRKPDYLVVHHMEPDHSANVAAFAQKYPEATLVATAKAFAMMKQFFGTDYADRRIVVKEGFELNLGKHTLTFILAPMVHWPEVMMSYDSAEKTLFSADAFGKFGALDREEPWDDEARRYYIGIVGKYGVQVQAVLKKAAKLDITRICALHGPVLEGDLSHYIGKYQTWSSYSVEDKGVTLAYASIYGHTADAALRLAEQLRSRGVPVECFDLARCDMSQAVAAAFRRDTLVLAASSYNGDVFPFMRTYLTALAERNFQGRRVALIENGSWAPTAARSMTKLLEGCKNLSFAEHAVTIRSALNEESEAALAALADELSQ